MMLQEIQALLAANGHGVSGTSLFRMKMPLTPDVCYCVYAFQGQAPQGGFGIEGPQYEFPGLQVVVRGEAQDSDGPYALAKAVSTFLMSVQPGAIGGVEYLRIVPSGEPFRLKTDDQEREYWACNFICEKEPS